MKLSLRQSMTFAALASLLALPALAKGSYMNSFNSTYGTSGTRLDTCGVCHYDFGGGGARNWYGLHFEANNHSFASIANLYSDGDAVVNSSEIVQLYLPGLTCNDLSSTSGAPADVGTYVVPGQVCGGAVDADGDGYSPPNDCNDSDPSINPGAAESCTDGIDNDCDGKIDAQDPNAVGCPLVCTDADLDTYAVQGSTCGPVDCNDANASVNPGAVESCTNGIDDDCDGLVDGADTDCGACVPTASSESRRKCSNGIDDDCDGLTDAADPDCTPSSPEVCNDGIDNDKDGKTDCLDTKDCGKSPYCQ